jgi:hypothetical protein
MDKGVGKEAVAASRIDTSKANKPAGPRGLRHVVCRFWQVGPNL